MCAVCVCVYVNMCVCVVCMCMCACVRALCVHVYVHCVCMCVCALYVHVYACVCACVCMCVCACVQCHLCAHLRPRRSLSSGPAIWSQHLRNWRLATNLKWPKPYPTSRASSPWSTPLLPQVCLVTLPPDYFQCSSPLTPLLLLLPCPPHPQLSLALPPSALL